MSNDTKTTEASNQPVDLDEIEVEVLFIAKKASGLKHTASFLSRRGWPTTVLDNLSKAIEFISEKQPDFILLSVNHPSPGISKLPDLIVQNFNLTCIGFAEGLEASSVSKLNNYKVQHKISGQASGPNVHRAIRKILSERFNIQTEDSSHSSAKEKAEGSSKTVIKGTGTSAADGPTMIQKSGIDNSMKSAMVHGSDGASGDMAIESNSSNPNGGKKRKSLKELSGDARSPITSDHDAHGKNKDSLRGTSHNPAQMTSEQLAEMIKKSIAAEEAGPQPAPEPEPIDDSLLNLDFEAIGNSAMRSLAPNPPPTAGTSEKDFLEDVERVAAAMKAAASSTGEGAGTADMSSLSPASSFAPPQSPAPSASSSTQLSPQPPAPSANASSRNAESVDNGVSSVNKSPGDENITELQRAIQFGLRETLAGWEKTRAKPLAEVEEIAVIPIDADTGSGYIVMAWPKETISRDVLLPRVQHCLKKSFAQLSVAGTIESGFWIPVPKIAFKPWAQKQGDFHFLMEQKEFEVAVTFIATHQALPKVRSVANSDMLAVGVKDISTEEPVNFQAYLHLEKNQRHYLYLRAGRRLQPKQKERLQKAKVKDFHMKNSDGEKVREFLVNAHLNECIRKFKAAG